MPSTDKMGYGDSVMTEEEYQQMKIRLQKFESESLRKQNMRELCDSSTYKENGVSVEYNRYSSD